METVPYRLPARTDEETLGQLQSDYEVARTRRTCRRFSTRPVPQAAIETAISIAGTAPSGAHRQPWRFVAISAPEIKQKIRIAAEEEEKAFYEKRAPQEWLEALKPFGTGWRKPHLTEAPWLIAVFRVDATVHPDGTREKNYYMAESVGIAVGFLVQALHRAGLATLTHTPAPMNFLREICGRPGWEKPFVLLPVGYPAEDAEVPKLERKPFKEIAELLI
ncbi:MAG: nitroreductase family protein [Fimbriimonadaceae bacterium]